MAESYFRGMRAIEDVLKRLKPLADWTLKFKPEQQHLALKRTDLDVIRRWPRAAGVVGFAVRESGVFYRSLKLYPDTGPGRYEKRAEVIQESI